MAPKETFARRRLPTILRLLCFVALWMLPIHAEVIAYIYQSGTDVLSSYAGTINFSDLALISDAGTTPAFIAAAIATEVFEGTPGGAPVYLGITGPANLGTGSEMLATTTTGDTFGFAGDSVSELLLPIGYVSGSSISGTDTWDDTSLAGLGLIAGTYNYTWGTGPNADSVVLNIGFAPVPEPSSLGLMSLAVLALLVFLRCRRASSV
jgi:hypothetical protein